VEQLGAGSRTEGVQTLLQSAFEFVGSHGRRLRRSTVTRVIRRACPGTRTHLAHKGVLFRDGRLALRRGLPT